VYPFHVLRCVVVSVDEFKDGQQYIDRHIRTIRVQRYYGHLLVDKIPLVKNSHNNDE
jgi:hypothetical protein